MSRLISNVVLILFSCAHSHLSICTASPRLGFKKHKVLHAQGDVICVASTMWTMNALTCVGVVRSSGISPFSPFFPPTGLTESSWAKKINKKMWKKCMNMFMAKDVSSGGVLVGLLSGYADIFLNL